LLIGIWLIWAEVVTAFGILREVDLWHTTQEVSQTITDAEGNTRVQTLAQSRAITLADLLKSIVILLMTFLATKNLPGILEVFLLQKFGLGTGERHAVSTIIRYTIIVIGAGIVFKIIGFGWGKVQWLVAALGVGIGFGLQEIVANFISGLILLFERPIRIGDTVTVGDVTGTVSKIRIRATSITDWDRKELIVPNKEFITGKLVNWTLSDEILRVVIPVGIAYGSDTEKAKEIMIKVAKGNGNVLQDPPPSVVFTAFGASSLDFALRAFTKMDTLLSVRDELHMAVDKAFREAGIEIAFPQRDIHIRSVNEPSSIVPQEPTEE
jgi:potassium efflux system protein